jgi:hypothetical protein
MSGALASGPVSRTDGRHLNYTAVAALQDRRFASRRAHALGFAVWCLISVGNDGLTIPISVLWPLGHTLGAFPIKAGLTSLSRLWLF